MSPIAQTRGKVSPPSNLYTVILAMAFGVVLATAAYVTFACYTQYRTVFTMP